MVEKARLNTDKTGYNNIEFFLGDIENMPFDDNLTDVVVSNFVLNLVPDKKQAFSEIFRILKPGGHFSISDVVIKGSLPDSLKEAAELYAGCIAGAINNEKYLSVIDNAGFKNINIQKQKTITLPRELLKKYMDGQEIEVFKKSCSGIFSITIYGEK
jgi:ubiquinone/menaquinone biosynthesis C-methylase UbiE